MTKLKLTGAYLLDIAKILYKTLRSKKFWLAIGIFLSYYLIFWFGSNYTLHGPIKKIEFQPIIQKRIKDTPKLQKSQETAQKQAILAKNEVVETEKDPLEEIYQQTRQFESGKGTAPTPGSTHLYCQSIGEVNEIGYFPQGDRKFCFKDEAEQKLTFLKWLEKRIDEGMTIKEALCYYVSGIKGQPQCQRTIDMGL